MKLRLHHIEMCVKDPGPVIGTLNQQFGLELVGKRETTLCSQSVLKLGRTVFVVTSRKSLSSFSPSTPNSVLNNSKNSCDESLNGKGHSFKDMNDKHVNSTELENGKDEQDHDEGASPELNESKQKRKKMSNDEPWTIFCCQDKNLDLDLDPTNNNAITNKNDHIDSVFNIAIEVKDLTSCINRLQKMDCVILREVSTTSDKYGSVKYAIVKACCGNVIHTLIEKINYTGWFLPEFQSISVPVPTSDFETKSTSSSSCSNLMTQQQPTSAISYFDHVALVCHMGESNSILSWYQQAFEMKRFITNRQETEEEGLVIGDDVGMRLKVLEFWKCSEVGLASTYSNADGNDHSDWEPLKIVVVESLPTIKNTQVENFIKDHNGPGLQHIGLHTSDMMSTVRELVERGVRFRYPPPTYYTEIGQLASIQEVGENPEKLSKYGVLLDTEADVFEDMEEEGNQEANITTDKTLNGNTMKTPRYLMQIFTYPIFDRDTFFLEVIQRKGARGFGVGNVTALARSVNAYQKQLLESRQRAEAK